MKTVTFKKSKKIRIAYDNVLAGASTFSKVEYFKEKNVPFCLTHCKDAFDKSTKLFSLAKKKYS